MSDTVIKIENLWKKYRLGVLSTRVLAYDLNRWWYRIRGKPDPYLKIGQQAVAGVGAKSDPLDIFDNAPCDLSDAEMWALRAINLEVKQGEVLGIIGRNGAGKSTLLKILSRVTIPTSGECRVKGRIASLLEVGTGFHPELTGRENIYLNGAILGMTKNEIRKKLDEVVAFSEVEKYIDTPVKRYSSGMYVRLAFAVAAHLEPEILIIDEVLAVGDAQFQKKCLGKMEDVAKGGRTVLFVSHNMAAISSLCGKAILLNNGHIDDFGSSQQIIRRYLTSFQHYVKQSLYERSDRKGNGKAKLKSIYLSTLEGNLLHELLSGQECMMNIEYESIGVINKPIFSFTIYNQHGQPLVHCNSSVAKTFFDKVPKHGVVICNFNRLSISSGSYRLNAAILDGDQVMDHVEGAYAFTVNDGDYFGTGRVIGELNGICLVDHYWRLKERISP